MGDNNSHSEEKVLLYVFIGIGLAALAYLFFKDQFKKDNTIQSSTQSVGTGLGSLGIDLGRRTTSQFALSNPRIDELEKQTVDLEIQTNALKDQLKLYDYKIDQLKVANNQVNNQDSLNEMKTIPKTYNLSGNFPSRAGSITTIRTTGEDKIRQKDFGMQ
jgi:hypothetical protein